MHRHVVCRLELIHTICFVGMFVESFAKSKRIARSMQHGLPQFESQVIQLFGLIDNDNDEWVTYEDLRTSLGEDNNGALLKLFQAVCKPTERFACENRNLRECAPD